MPQLNRSDSVGKRIPRSRTSATSLLKGLRILGLFSSSQPEWRVGEMSVAVGAAKSTVSRIARTLEDEGFLIRVKHREGYRLGIRLWELGSCAIVDKAEFHQHALPYLEILANDLNQSVQAAILDGNDVVYVQKVDADQALRPYIPLGARFPTHCTATGKALLAFQSEERIAEILKRELKRYTDRTITTRRLLRAALEQVRARGFAINRAEWRADVAGVAAPVFDRTGAVIGAIGVTMPLSQFPREVNSPISSAIVAAAQHLSRDLGYVRRSEPRFQSGGGRMNVRSQRSLTDIHNLEKETLI